MALGEGQGLVCGIHCCAKRVRFVCLAGVRVGGGSRSGYGDRRFVEVKVMECMCDNNVNGLEKVRVCVRQGVALCLSACR